MIISIFQQATTRTITEGDEIFKTQLGAQTREIYQKVVSSRKQEEKSFKSLMIKREEVISDIASKVENERRLNEIILSIQSFSSSDEKNAKSKFDINLYVQQYKEITGSGYKSDLCSKVHMVISNKKEEMIQMQIKKIPNGKEKEFKQIANQHLEDIKVNQWSIDSEIIERLSLLAK